MTPGSSSQETLPSSSTLVVSEPFKHAHNFTIGDYSNFGTVHGSQNNYYNTEVKKKRFIVGTEEEEAEYGEFSEIKRGDVIAFQNVHSSPIERFDTEQREWVKLGEQTVVAGEVRIGGVASKCMAVSYSGEGAEERWKESFRRLGGVRRPENAQLVAINLSSIPMLILTGNLVPVEPLVDQVGGMVWMYLMTLAMQMGCWEDGSLWMDTSRGVFCRGPEGQGWIGRGFKLDNLPLDAELVKEDVLIRYLASRKLDRKVVDWLSLREREGGASQVKVERPTVISTLDNTILAVGSGFWKESRFIKNCLGERTELPNATTRFTLEHNQHRLELWLEEDEPLHGWFAQAPSVFHTHGVSLEGDMSPYKLILPKKLEGTLSCSKDERRRRQECSPIYLFLSTSIFWSFDQDGQTPIPTSLCRHLGLPFWELDWPTSLSLTCQELHWPTSHYKTLQDYQVARSFNPTTTDFAQHNEYRIYEVVKNRLSCRFEEIDDLDTTEDSPSSATSTHHPARASTSDSGHQEDLNDMPPGLLFGDTPLKAHQGSSADNRRKTSGCLLQKGSPSKPPVPPSAFQAASQTISGLKPAPKPIAPRRMRTPAKPLTVPKPPEVTMRKVAPPSRGTPLNGVKEGTKAVPPVNRGTSPRGPICPGDSTTSVRARSVQDTVSTVSRTPPVISMSKPAPAKMRTSPEASGLAPTSTSTIKTPPRLSSSIPYPNRTRIATERTTTRIGGQLPPSTPLPTGATAIAKKSISHPTAPRPNGAATVLQQPPSIPRQSTLRTPTMRGGNAVASSSGVQTRPTAVQERTEESHGRSPRRTTMTAKESSSPLPPSRPPAVVVSRAIRPPTSRFSVQRK